MRGCRGMCMVAGRGVHDCRGGVCGCQGACMVARGCAWLPGGMCGCPGGWGACMVAGGGVRRIRRDTVNERAVRILLECILVSFEFEMCSVKNFAKIDWPCNK